jgi:hypothetical protein
MEVLDLDLVEIAGSDDVEAAVSDDVEGIGSTDVDGTGSGDVVEVDSYVARGTRSGDVEGTIPETVSDNVDDTLEFSLRVLLCDGTRRRLSIASGLYGNMPLFLKDPFMFVGEQNMSTDAERTTGHLALLRIWCLLTKPRFVAVL